MLQNIWDRSLLDVLRWKMLMRSRRFGECLHQTAATASTGCSSSRILSPLPGKGVSKRQGRSLACSDAASLGSSSPFGCNVQQDDPPRRSCEKRWSEWASKSNLDCNRSSFHSWMGRRHPAPVTRLSSWHLLTADRKRFEASSESWWTGVGKPRTLNVIKCPDPRGSDEG